MTVRYSVQIHFAPVDISHRFRRGSFATLDIGGANIHFEEENPAKVDAVIAELVALRAEMTGEPAPAAANPPRHMTGMESGPMCEARDGGFICNAQDGHDGPDHVAYGGEYEVYRWPVAAARDDRAGSASVAS